MVSGCLMVLVRDTCHAAVLARCCRQVFRLLRAMMAYKAEDRPLPEELLEDPWFAPIDAVDQQQQVQPAQAQVQQLVAAAAAAPKELQEQAVVSVQVQQGAAPADAAAAAAASTPASAGSAMGV